MVGLSDLFDFLPDAGCQFLRDRLHGAFGLHQFPDGLFQMIILETGLAFGQFLIKYLFGIQSVFPIQNTFQQLEALGLVSAAQLPVPG